MPRNLRIDYAGARHHLFNRARQPAELFRDDDDCVEFLSLVAELPERFGVQVHAWCLMPTHYHLLVRSMRGQLSGAAQFLQSQHARLFNRRRKMAGPLFRGRFGSRLVEDDPYWLYLVGYIHLNPVKDRLCASPDQAAGAATGSISAAIAPPSG
jgi:putative transposase